MDVEIGKVISVRVSELLKTYTTSEDRADVSRQFPISASTLRDVIYRRNSVTENSLPPIKALIGCAEKKATSDYNDSRKGKKDLRKILATI